MRAISDSVTQMLAPLSVVRGHSGAYSVHGPVANEAWGMMSQRDGRNLGKKLKDASWAELATRGRQELAKRWDYALYRLGAGLHGPGWLVSPRTPPGKFFFSSNGLPSLCEELRQRFPDGVTRIQESAERICAHRFSLLGYEDINFGPHIDWHADLVHSKGALLKPWFKVHYLDFDEVGDSKIIWELNRHQFLVTLAKAYLLTKEQRYAEELFRLWYDWRQKNPYPLGINWASSLEVAFRSLSWIWVDHLLQGSEAMPQAFSKDLMTALALHGRHIEKYLSTYFSPNTHLLGEGVALFFLGTLYPGLRNASRWKKRGWQIVQQQAMRQVQSDGMHFEGSLHYHVYALDFFLHARILSSLNQVSMAAEFDQAIIKMLEVLCTLSQAGALPHFGDDDGGRVFDPERNRVEHLLDPLSTAAVIFDRGDFKAAGALCEETLWLLGREGLARFDSLPQTKPRVGAALPSSGLYVMADHSGTRQQLVIDAGSLGAGRAGHSHADALSLQLSVNGREFLSDPGTFSYVSAAIDRNKLRGTGAHNTLQIDGLDQAEPDGPFGWRALPRVTVETWQNEKTFDLLVANLSLSQRPSSAVVHQRTVFYLRSRFWFVRDVIMGSGEHQLDLSWHFPPGLNILQGMVPGSFAVCRSGEELCLALLTAEDEDNFQCGMEEDCWSPSYGKMLSSSTLRISRKGLLPWEFATILVPLGGAAADRGHLIRVDAQGKDAALRCYTYSEAAEAHHFIFNDSGLKWIRGSWSSNARFFYWATSLRGELLRWIVSRGSFLALDGHPFFQENETVECRESKSSSTVVTVEREGRSSSRYQAARADVDKVLLPTAKTNETGNR